MGLGAIWVGAGVSAAVWQLLPVACRLRSAVCDGKLRQMRVMGNCYTFVG